MRLINADELMELYENTPDCNIDDCSVPIPVIRQNILDMPTVNPYKWIGVDDRLPEENTDVLIYRGGFIGDLMNVYTYKGHNEWEDEYGYWSRTEDEGITHWMYLPEPPKD